MKIQSLAVIFVLIILPISIVLSEYVRSEMDTIKLQTQYDSRLISATYDSVAAFQKNTVNSNFSDITTSKMRDIEASANVFFNSVANSFKMSGNTQDAIKEFVPALVYTLYDGYYIYSPFYNNLGDIDVNADSSYQDTERTFGLKPYIYYSKEYSGTDYDVVITYSLDNYITVQGNVTTIDGEKKVINESGYIIDITNSTDDGRSYKGIEIKNGENDDDKIFEYVDETDNRYECVKVNGTKYYLEGNNKVFYTIKNQKEYLSPQNAQEYISNYFGDNNNMARNYYKESREFTNRILNTYNLKEIKIDGQSLFADQAKDVEYYGSVFNQERRNVIKTSIEKNLSVAIANFNNITKNSTANFQMPKLKEDEWDKIINNISIISFLQGINMGTRTYNGYAIVTNNKNEENVGEETIYITTKNGENGEYHRINDKDLLENGIQLNRGIFNVNFESKAIDVLGADGSVEKTKYYYPNRELACYNSIINQTGVNLMEQELSDGTKVPKTVYEYLDEIIAQNKPNAREIASLYYTALGRERRGNFNVNNKNSSEWTNYNRP